MSYQKIKINKIQSKLTLKIKRAISQVPYADFLTVLTKPQYTDNIENGLNVKLNHQRQKQISNIFSILLSVNILMQFLYYQLDVSMNNHTEIWLIFTYLVHIACYVLFTIRQIIEFEKLSRFNKNQYNYPLVILKNLLFFILQPMPWINHLYVDIIYDDMEYKNLEFPLKTNYILIIISILKNIVSFFNSLLINTNYLGPRSNRIKKIYSVHAKSTIYAIRCILRDVPLKIFFGFYVLGIIYFSFSIQVLQASAPIFNNPFKYYQNCIWFVMITTTTVGFGDFRMVSHIGYIFSVFCMIWGSLCLSCLLVILVNTLGITSKEQTCLKALKRVQIQLQYQQLCRLYIRKSLWRLWKNYKSKQKMKQPIEQRKMRHQLSKIRRISKSINATGNISQLAQAQFDNCLINIQYLLQNNSQLLNFIGNQIFSQKLYQQYTDNVQPQKSQSYIIPESQTNIPNGLLDISKKQSRFSKAYGLGSSKHIKIKILKQPSEDEISEYSSPKKKKVNIVI